MKLRLSLLLLIAASLAAGPTLAADRTYNNGGSILVITSPSAVFNNCSVFYPVTPPTPVGDQDPKTGCEIGTSPWEGPDSELVIDPDPGGNFGTDLPVLKVSITHSLLSQEFSCATTSNAATNGTFDPIAGCRVLIQSDTYNEAVLSGLPVVALSITPDETVFKNGYAVQFPNLNNDPYGGEFFPGVVEPGQGTYCDAWCDPALNGGSCTTQEDQLLEGGLPGEDPYCTRVLGYLEEAWTPAERGGTGGSGLQAFINPLPVPLFHFSSDGNRVAVPASSAIGDYQIFSNLIFGDAIRGNLVGSTSWTDGAFKVPLAPLAALGALGGSLAFMGYSALRRRD